MAKLPTGINLSGLANGTTILIGRGDKGGLSNIDSIALLPQIPGGKNYLDLHVVRAEEPTLGHIINRRARDPTRIACASNIGRWEVWKIGSLRDGHAAMFRCTD